MRSRRRIAFVDSCKCFEARAWEDLGKQDLVRLQNIIVTDPRVRDDDYRSTQNYVGRSGVDAIDFIAPRALPGCSRC